MFHISHSLYLFNTMSGNLSSSFSFSALPISLFCELKFTWNIRKRFKMFNSFLICHVPLKQNNVLQLVFKMFKITYSYVVYFYYRWYSSELGNEKYGI